MNRRLRNIGMSAIVGVVFSMLALLAGYRYVSHLAAQQLEEETGKVRQSFATSIKDSEIIASSLQGLLSAIGDASEDRFQKVTTSFLKDRPYLKAISYYRLVSSEERAHFEEQLRKANKDPSISESTPEDVNKVRPAGQRAQYLALAMADAQTAPNSYYGWDLYSDKGKAKAASLALSQTTLQASETFLLDSGHVAFELYAPAFANGNAQSSGLIGMVIDLPELLGDAQWRKFVTVDLSTVLEGETNKRDLYRSNDQDEVSGWVLLRLSSDITIQAFGQTLDLTFSREYDWHKIHRGILLMIFFACLLLTLMMVYLAKTLADLADSNDKLAEINRDLENTVAIRTKDLREANEEIQEIFENLDDGILVVSDGFRIQPRYSPKAPAILGLSDLAGKTLKDSVFKDLDQHVDRNAIHFTSLNFLLGADDFQWSLSKRNLLPELEYKHPTLNSIRNLSLRYAPLYENGEIKRLLVVISDVTEFLALKKGVEEEQKRADAKTRVFSELLKANRSTLDSFCAEADDRIRDLISGANRVKESRSVAAANELFRDLHTLKGNARFAGLTFVSQKVHAIEDRFSESRNDLDKSDLDPLIQEIADLGTLTSEYTKAYREIFASKGKSIEAKILALVLKLIKKDIDREQVDQLANALIEEKIGSFNELVANFSPMVADISASLEKPVREFSFGPDLFVSKKVYSALQDAFTHLFRNALDHGLESPEERKRLGKPEMGTLSATWRLVGDQVEIKVADDGSGVDCDRVLKIAREKHLPGSEVNGLSEEQIIEFLFAPNFSTKDAVSAISGRGVGLDAVRAIVEENGGKISMHSKRRQGSEFVIWLPKSCVFFCEA